MNPKSLAIILLIFLCVFFGVLAIGTSQVRTDFALITIDILLMLIARLDPTNTKTT